MANAVPPLPLTRIYRVAFHLGQLPWLGIYLGYIPGAGGPLNVLLEHGRKETRKRVARGSSARDLFYYLVRASSRGLCIVGVSRSHDP